MKFIKLQRQDGSKGFTLIELIVALGLFTIVALIALGALISMLDVNRHTVAMASVMNNLNFSLESMTREIRFGTSYQCQGESDCLNGEDSLTVIFDGDEITYSLDEEINAIMKESNGGTQRLTGEDVEIEDLSFYVTGVNDSVNRPYVVIVLRGVVRVGGAESRFTLQTSMVQRSADSPDLN